MYVHQPFWRPFKLIAPPPLGKKQHPPEERPPNLIFGSTNLVLNVHIMGVSFLKVPVLGQLVRQTNGRPQLSGGDVLF